MKQDELIIVDSFGDVVMRASAGSVTVVLCTHDGHEDFPVFTALDAGGVAALCDWLAAWIARREAGDVDDRQAALLLGDG